MYWDGTCTFRRVDKFVLSLSPKNNVVEELKDEEETQEPLAGNSNQDASLKVEQKFESTERKEQSALDAISENTVVESKKKGWF